MKQIRAIEQALATERSSKFWLAGCLAAGLAVMSWLNLVVVHGVNEHIFHVDPFSPRGWWLYLMLRVPVTLLLVYVVWSMATPPMQDVEGGARKHDHAKSRSSTFDPLMGLRAFACFMVVMGHFFLVTTPFTHEGVHPFVWGLLTTSPWAGVWLFFTLSGFLMGKGFAYGRYSLDEAGMRGFLRNRLLRIAPIYFGAVVVIGVFRYPALFIPRNWWMLLLISVFDYRGDLPIPLDGALWSVSTEMQFYLMVPLLMVGLIWLSRRMKRTYAAMPFLVLLLGGALRLLVHHYEPNGRAYVYTPVVMNLDLFLCGMSLSLLPRNSLTGVTQRRWVGWGMFAAMLLFYIGTSELAAHREALHMNLEQYWARVPWTGALFSAGFIYFAERMGKVVVHRSLKGLLLLGAGWAGTLTYCVYVFHGDVFFSVASMLPKVHGLALSLKMFPLSLAEVLALASLFYFLVEKPFDRRKRIAGSALVDAP